MNYFDRVPTCTSADGRTILECVSTKIIVSQPLHEKELMIIVLEIALVTGAFSD